MAGPASPAASRANGGDIVADVLIRHGVSVIFTLCGGHISPIVVSAARRGVRVIDVRHEATAVFAADATARLTGAPGVAVVTAGPGATNAVTAVKIALVDQSPVVLLGGAPPTVLQGRGALQDIDHQALFAPHVKWTTTVRRVRDLATRLTDAFTVARQGVPGPVFVECPADVLYPASVVRSWFNTMKLTGVRRWYLQQRVDRVWAGMADDDAPVPKPVIPAPRPPTKRFVARALTRLEQAERPVLLVGSQAMLEAGQPGAAKRLRDAVATLGMPTYCSGMARGLLGANHPLLLRSGRRAALREADLIVLAGVPADFRLEYGLHLPRSATVIAANRSARDLTLNRRPTVGGWCDPALFLEALAARWTSTPDRWSGWLTTLHDREREPSVDTETDAPTHGVHPIALLGGVDQLLDESSTLVVDGGDFAATSAYVTRPRAPLHWLDPGPLGTLGIGAGFAIAAAVHRPGTDIWVLFGDGAFGFSTAEFDTFVRHRLPVLAVVGNDGAWMQIARAQRELLGDDVATTLRQTDYEQVAIGFGACGLRIERADDVGPVLSQALEASRAGSPTLVNALLGPSTFRQDAIAL